METYRLSSRLKEAGREYMIQTANDAAQGSVATTVYVEGVRTETIDCPHPAEVTQDQMLSLVKLTHGEKKKELETLLRAYAQAIQKDDPELMYQLGTAFFYRRFFNEASELFDRVLHTLPDHHQAWNYLGMTWLAVGQTERALEAAKRAAEQRPGFADYRNNLGEAHLAVGQAVPAISEFEQAISINMYYGDAYFNLALAHLLEASRGGSQGRAVRLIEKVVECFNKAAMIYPDYRRHSDYEEGMRVLKRGDFARALELFQSVRDAKKERHRREFAAYYMRFVLYPEWVTEKSVGDRVLFLEQELRRNPGYVDMQTELAKCYLEQSRILCQKAARQFGRVADTHPGMPGLAQTIESVSQVQQRMDEIIRRIARKG